MNLFDESTYPRQKIPWGRCFSCCQLPKSPSRRLEADFRGMTGVNWLGEVTWFNIHRDFQTLGLDTSKLLAERVPLCCACSVSYMKKFNELNDERRQSKVTT